jgi:hypothetical protein
MIPKPRINLLVYHGVFAPHARDRRGAVRRAHEGAGRLGRSPGAGGDTETAGTANGGAVQDSPAAQRRHLPRRTGLVPIHRLSPRHGHPPPAGYTRPEYYRWADLLPRTFAIDVLACPECGGRLRFLATIEDRAVIEKILGHLALPVDPPTAAPARVTEWLPGVD